MQVKTISTTYSRKINLGNYSSIDLGCTMWADLDPGENPTAATAELMESCREQVRGEASGLLQSITQSRKGKTATLGIPGKPDPAIAAQTLSEFQEPKPEILEDGTFPGEGDQNAAGEYYGDK